MRRATIFVLSLSVLCISAATLSAQNVCLDYIRNVPRQYGPYDPWTVGLVMRYQTGHGGHFYNCDCEEHKRLSPYIRWERQPSVCCPHCHCWYFHEQIDEIRQRVRTGSCKQCQYRLCQRCTTSQPRPLVDCPGAGCQTCANCGAIQGASPIPDQVPMPYEAPVPDQAPLQPAPVPEQPANSTSWLQNLYSR